MNATTVNPEGEAPGCRPQDRDRAAVLVAYDLVHGKPVDSTRVDQPTFNAHAGRDRSEAARAWWAEHPEVSTAAWWEANYGPEH